MKEETRDEHDEDDLTLEWDADQSPIDDLEDVLLIDVSLSTEPIHENGELIGYAVRSVSHP